jgi:hypothetical protein
MATSPPEPALAALAGTVSALSQQAADLRRRLDTLERHAAAAGLDRHAADLAALAARVEELSGTVAGAFDTASPKGPAAPRWDRLDPRDRAAQLERLRCWVDGILRPAYCAGGAYTLGGCWDKHEAALWELGALAARWRQIFERDRPDLGLALEFFDRWLPGTMRRVEAMQRNCATGHRPAPGLHWAAWPPRPRTWPATSPPRRSSARSWPTTRTPAS